MKLIVDMTNAKVWSFATSSKGTVDIHFDGPVTFHTEDTQPAEQPSETCKCDMLWPSKYCPNCGGLARHTTGNRIEVVE